MLNAKSGKEMVLQVEGPVLEPPERDFKTLMGMEHE